METVNCPFCDDEHEAEELFDGYVDGDERDIDCDCGKTFKVIQNIYLFYTTDPDKDFEEYLNRHPETREQLNRIKAETEAKIKEYSNAKEKV